MRLLDRSGSLLGLRTVMGVGVETEWSWKTAGRCDEDDDALASGGSDPLRLGRAARARWWAGKEGAKADGGGGCELIVGDGANGISTCCLC